MTMMTTTMMPLNLTLDIFILEEVMCMPAWMVVFVIVWSTLSVFAAVLLGAFVTYCQKRESNPLTQLKCGFFTPPESKTKPPEEPKGFYE